MKIHNYVIVAAIEYMRLSSALEPNEAPHTSGQSYLPDKQTVVNIMETSLTRGDWKSSIIS